MDDDWGYPNMTQKPPYDLCLFDFLWIMLFFLWDDYRIAIALLEISGDVFLNS